MNGRCKLLKQGSDEQKIKNLAQFFVENVFLEVLGMGDIASSIPHTLMAAQLHMAWLCIGVGAQSNLRGKTFLAEKNVRKINKMPEFDDICPKK